MLFRSAHTARIWAFIDNNTFARIARGLAAIQKEEESYVAQMLPSWLSRRCRRSHHVTARHKPAFYWLCNRSPPESQKCAHRSSTVQVAPKVRDTEVPWRPQLPPMPRRRSPPRPLRRPTSSSPSYPGIRLSKVGNPSFLTLSADFGQQSRRLPSLGFSFGFSGGLRSRLLLTWLAVNRNEMWFYWISVAFPPCWWDLAIKGRFVSSFWPITELPPITYFIYFYEMFTGASNFNTASARSHSFIPATLNSIYGPSPSTNR